MSSATAVPTALPRAGWLATRGFDLTFVFGTMGLALAVALAVAAVPGAFAVLVLPYLWLLGWPHVVSTFSRTAFDRESFARHRFLNLGLPALILAAAALVAATLGTWPLVTTYLYWQWFHFTRQSYGVSRFYARRAETPIRDGRLTHWLIYLVPVWGILYRSYQAPETYLGSAVWVVPVPFAVVAAVGGVTCVLLAWWVAGRVAAYLRGDLPVAHTLYVASHFAMFGAGYLLIRNIDYGWLALSVWHSAQYLLFVGLYNRNQFRGGADPKRPFLSALSRPKRGLRFYLVCCAIGVVALMGLDFALRAVNIAVVPASLVVIYAINFHHYTVDAVIWRARAKPRAA